MVALHMGFVRFSIYICSYDFGFCTCYDLYLSWGSLWQFPASLFMYRSLDLFGFHYVTRRRELSFKIVEDIILVVY